MSDPIDEPSSFLHQARGADGSDRAHLVAAFLGTKLAVKSPCCEPRPQSIRRPAPSVFRPGTALICWALATTTSKKPSRRRYTCTHYTPVLSMPTWLHCSCTSQARKANRSAVSLRNVRISLRRCPASILLRHTTRKRRCTSMPAHRCYITSLLMFTAPFSSVLFFPVCGNIPGGVCPFTVYSSCSPVWL